MRTAASIVGTRGPCSPSATSTHTSLPSSSCFKPSLGTLLRWTQIPRPSLAETKPYPSSSKSRTTLPCSGASWAFTSPASLREWSCNSRRAALKASRIATYEVVEWIAATLFGGELGIAYVGAQGDFLDAQKDMALATLRALLATSVGLAGDRQGT